jgi:hypothetical protein
MKTEIIPGRLKGKLHPAPSGNNLQDRTRNVATGSTISVWRDDSKSPPFLVLCETHNQSTESPGRNQSTIYMRDPSGWCSGCAKIMEGK